MKKTLSIISNVLEIMTVICFLVLATLIFFQIGGRWTGIKDIGWTDEMISCFTTWMVFLGFAYMCERDEHIQITMLQDVLPSWVKTVMVLTIRVVNIICGIAMAYSGHLWTNNTATKITPSLQVPYNIWYNSVWICSVVFAVFATVKLLETVASLVSKKS